MKFCLIHTFTIILSCFSYCQGLECLHKVSCSGNKHVCSQLDALRLDLQSTTPDPSTINVCVQFTVEFFDIRLTFHGGGRHKTDDVKDISEIPTSCQQSEAATEFIRTDLLTHVTEFQGQGIRNACWCRSSLCNDVDWHNLSTATKSTTVQTTLKSTTEAYPHQTRQVQVTPGTPGYKNSTLSSSGSITFYNNVSGLSSLRSILLHGILWFLWQ